MSKDLFLIRHAAAHEREAGQKDIDRFLASEGVQTATKTGHYFKKEGIQPDMIISSPAVRARATATLIAEQLKYNTEQIHINEELFEASVRTLLQTVNHLKDSWECVFIIGHNPSISYLSEYLTREEIGSIEAGGFVHIGVTFDKWEKVSEGSCKLVEYKDPGSYDF